MSESINLGAAVVNSLDERSLERLAELLAPKMARRFQTAPADDGWIDSKEAARYTGVTLSSLWKLTAGRKIPFSQDKAGGKLWFKRSELDAWRIGL